jgi:hypothetical protein
MVLRRLRSSCVGDGGHHLPWHPNAVDGVVRDGVADDEPEARISALGLKRVLGIGSEQTAWAMLHRYRTAMVRPGRDRLGTIVEVDETVQARPTCQPRRRAPRPPVAPPVKPAKPINPHRLH